MSCTFPIDVLPDTYAPTYRVGSLFAPDNTTAKMHAAPYIEPELSVTTFVSLIMCDNTMPQEIYIYVPSGGRMVRALGSATYMPLRTGFETFHGLMPMKCLSLWLIANEMPQRMGYIIMPTEMMLQCCNVEILLRVPIKICYYLFCSIPLRNSFRRSDIRDSPS